MTPNNPREDRVNGIGSALFNVVSVISVLMLVAFAYAAWLVLSDLQRQSANVDKISADVDKISADVDKISAETKQVDSEVRQAKERSDATVAGIKKDTELLQASLDKLKGETEATFAARFAALEKAVDEIPGRIAGAKAKPHLLTVNGPFKIEGNDSSKVVGGLSKKLLLPRNATALLWLRAYPAVSKHRSEYILSIDRIAAGKSAPVLSTKVYDNSPPIDLVGLIELPAGESTIQVAVKGVPGNFAFGTFRLGDLPEEPRTKLVLD